MSWLIYGAYVCFKPASLDTHSLFPFTDLDLMSSSGSFSQIKLQLAMLLFAYQTPCGVTVLWMCTRKNIMSFSPHCTFSGGQVSEPGQAGESEPGGRQGCASKHQHQNQLQHPSNIVSKPEGKNRKQKKAGEERNLNLES